MANFWRIGGERGILMARMRQASMEEIEGFQEFTGLAAPWYSLPFIEERKEESREVSR